MKSSIDRNCWHLLQIAHKRGCRHDAKNHFHIPRPFRSRAYPVWRSRVHMLGMLLHNVLYAPKTQRAAFLANIIRFPSFCFLDWGRMSEG